VHHSQWPLFTDSLPLPLERYEVVILDELWLSSYWIIFLFSKRYLIFDDLKTHEKEILSIRAA